MNSLRQRSLILTALAVAALPLQAAFQAVPRALITQNLPQSTGCSHADQMQKFMFFADETPEGSLSVEIMQAGEDEESINEAAEFLIDSFWLDARHLVTQPAERETNALSVSEDARRSLYERQASDLFDNYGERMGKTILDSAVIKAVDTKTGKIVGLVCVSSLLFDAKTEEVLSTQDSEELLKAAVATLGPKVRRRYKDASAEDIAMDLLGGDMEAVCCISNLAVSPKARRTGIASQLCDEAERIASVEWGYDVMFLKVEADNTAARALYEGKLKYTLRCNEIAATALRVDVEAGQFVETQADTLILNKEL